MPGRLLESLLFIERVMGVYQRLVFLQITPDLKSLCFFSMIDILTNKKHVSIKPVIKGHHLYHMFCDLITMPRYRRNFCSRQSTVNFLWTMKNKLVCLVIKYIAFGNLLQKKRSVPPPPHFFSDGRL